ncbi:hypothetical protein [Paenibacillus sp. P32E]|uniref:hypothetical protein n=1 Tax=Paenibacillus sp. P32E TaxID=1349434 RepID=UPI00093D12C9|nr:hypothetical protein [Paenibacillus sp. P32E]OKP82536.1 hypothetical protein A3848_28335 [Paenibacillus sp. P32E]
MAKLQDHYDTNKFLNMEFICRDNRPDQGCSFKITNFEHGSVIASDIGWTNATLNKFIEMLTNFPMPSYEGYFSHYDESFEWKWEQQSETELYQLSISVSGKVFSYYASIKDFQEFGTQVSQETENAPNFDS